jgi:hypothetical protein
VLPNQDFPIKQTVKETSELFVFHGKAIKLEVAAEALQQVEISCRIQYIVLYCSEFFWWMFTLLDSCLQVSIMEPPRTSTRNFEPGIRD